MLKPFKAEVDVFSARIRMPERTSRSPNTTSADFASTCHGSYSALMQHLQRFSSRFDMLRAGGNGKAFRILELLLHVKLAVSVPVVCHVSCASLEACRFRRLMWATIGNPDLFCGFAMYGHTRSRMLFGRANLPPVELEDIPAASEPELRARSTTPTTTHTCFMPLGRNRLLLQLGSRIRIERFWGS